MQHADFVHLVRLSERASAEDGTGYRRSVAAFAALGYAWVAGCLLAAAAVLWRLGHALAEDRLGASSAAAALLAAALLWCGGRALWCRVRAPEGLRLKPAEAPALFEALERIRRKVNGPPIHSVVLTGELHAGIEQQPRWGLLGGARNHLSVGLPLLMALDRRRLLVVLAREYAHLRRDPGRFAAWVYRARANWTRMYAALVGSRGSRAAWTQPFLAWYFPRFVGRSFALARQDEFEADRIAARLAGAEVTAAALTELALKQDWLRQHFWPGHWALAGDEAAPVGPYQRMRKLLALPVPRDIAQRSLRHTLRHASGLDDPQPALRDRLDGLGLPARVPSWSGPPALALLGEAAQRCIAHFDERWSREHGTAWRQHHAALGRVRNRIGALLAQREKDAAAWTELGDLQRRLKHDDPAVRRCYDEALALAPQHGPALQGLYGCLPAEQSQQRMACLERLHQASPQHRWWAAQAAVAALEDDPSHGPTVLELWRARMKEAEAAEARAWSELTQRPFLEDTGPSDLSEFERYECEAELARWPDVKCAWLLRRVLREFPQRRSYLLVVDLPGLQPAQALQLCRALEPSLCLPGPVLLLWMGESPELAALRRQRPMYDARVLP